MACKFAKDLLLRRQGLPGILDDDFIFDDVIEELNHYLRVMQARIAINLHLMRNYTSDDLLAEAKDWCSSKAAMLRRALWGTKKDWDKDEAFQALCFLIPFYGSVFEVRLRHWELQFFVIAYLMNGGNKKNDACTPCLVELAARRSFGQRNEFVGKIFKVVPIALSEPGLCCWLYGYVTLSKEEKKFIYKHFPKYRKGDEFEAVEILWRQCRHWYYPHFIRKILG